jgi:hypothetical protein
MTVNEIEVHKKKRIPSNPFFIRLSPGLGRLYFLRLPIHQAKAVRRQRHRVEHSTGTGHLAVPEFSGDLVLARDDTGRCLIQFDKTPMAILNPRK